MEAEDTTPGGTLDGRQKSARPSNPYSSMAGGSNRLSMEIRPDEHQMLASGCLTPVRSITEIYRSAETRLQKLGHPHFSGNTVSGMRRVAPDDDAELMAASSDEGEYSIPTAPNHPAHNHPHRLHHQRHHSVAPIAPPPQTMPAWRQGAPETVVENLAHAVDQLRGFGPRKLTEQELARWRQLVRSDVALQARIVDARSVGELKSLTDGAEYRMIFTRTKWNQIMERLGEALTLPDLDAGVAGEKGALNLRLNLFKNFGAETSEKRTTVGF